MRPFEAAAVALHRWGYSPIPIIQGGKRPGVYRGFITDDGGGPWFGLPEWQQLCTERASEAKVASWGRMSDAMGGGIGAACGYGGLAAIDIDDDALVVPILAVLPPVVVAKRGRYGQTVFMRTIAPMPSTPYDGPDGRLLDFLSGGRQTVLPPTIHPDLNRPYEWTTERTLLNTPLEALPLFTDAHRAAMEKVLREHGWQAPEPAQPRREAVERPVVEARPRTSGPGQVARAEFWKVVIRTMRQWVPKLGLYGLERDAGGWRSVASFRVSGSGRPLEDRDLSLSIRDDGRIKDHGGTGLNAISLVGLCLFGGDNSAAYAWLCEESGFNDAPIVAPDEPVAPTYPDNRVSLDEAMASVRSVFSDKFTDAILEARAARNRAKIKRPLIFHVPPVEIIPPETGIGKTYTARDVIAPLTKAGMKFVYAVPDHGLAKEVVDDFTALDVSIDVYRGFDQPDPRAPKKYRMCRRPEAFKAVQSLGIATHSNICERRQGTARVLCPSFKQCALMKQRGKQPAVWIVPHALLFTKRPDFFFEPDAVVIDETFFEGAIAPPFEIDVEALRSASINEGCKYTDEEQDALTAYRHYLRDAVKDNGDGALSRAALIANGIDAETAGWLSLLERRPLDAVDLSPGMTGREIVANAKSFKAKATMARNADTMWDMIARFLYDRTEASGRLNVGGGTLSVSPVREVHGSWLEAPVVYMDATPPPVNLVEHALGRFSTQGLPSTVTKHPDIRARWSDHVHVRQVLGAPSTMSGVGVGSWARKTERHQQGHVADIVNYIRFHAALARPGRIGVITFKELRERIAGQLPDDIIWMHYGAVAGRNEMKTVTGLIVIGRPSAQRRSVEADAATITGRAIPAGDHRFGHVPGGIRMADGSVVATSMERHDDPDVEALRWLLTEGGLIQAIGRLRPHRRNEPCWLHILADVPLPIIVRETVRWKAVKPGVVGVMAAQGVILTNVSDAGLAFNLTDREGRGLVRFSKNNISLEKCTSPRPLRRFTYQKTGSGQKSWQGWYLPAVLPGGEAALRTWLEGKLGPLASLTVDRVKAKDSPAVQAMFAKIGRSLWQPSPLHLVATLRAAASWIEREAAEAPKASGSW